MTTMTRGKSGQVLLMSLITTVALTFFGLGLMQMGQAADLTETRLYRTAKTQWRSKSATDYAIWKLISSDVGATNDQQNTPGYTYDWGFDGVTLAFPLDGADDPDTASVEILVSAPDPTDTSLRAIRCENRIHTGNAVTRCLLDIERPPPALSMALLTEGNLKISGDASVTSHTEAVGTLNADIHTNKDLTITGQGTIKGFASASGTASIPPGSVVPPVNPDGIDPWYEGVDTVPVPDVNPALWLNDNYVHSKVPGANIVRMAGPIQTNNANWNFGGTAAAPTVIVINGDLRVTNGATLNITGYAILVVNGDIHMAANSRIGGDQGHLSMFGKNMHMASHSEVHGLVYVRSHFHLTSQAAIYGSAISKGYDPATGQTGTTMEMLTGQFDVYYEPSDESVFAEPGSPMRLSYQTYKGGMDWDQ